MRKKCNDFDAVGVERMTDAELSKKLGSYQRTESISIAWACASNEYGGIENDSRRFDHYAARLPK